MTRSGTATLALAVIGILGASPFAGEGRAEDPGLVVELNKLEPVDDGCRTFFLFRNRTGRELTGFEMSLAVLDSDGVIDRLLTIDAAPLPADRTVLKLFEITEISCDRIGEMLLHEITACAFEDGEEVDCFDFVSLASRAAAPLTM